MTERRATPVALAPWDSDLVTQARLDGLAAALEAPVPMGSFTDEELAGLEDPTGQPSAPSPWLTSLPPEEAQAAVTAALRGLTARGLYRATPRDPSRHAFEVAADPGVLALLTLRRHTSAVVVAERRSATSVDWVLLYAQRAGLWLAEVISPTGLHEFVLASVEHQVGVLTAWSGAADDLPVPDWSTTVSREQLGADPTVIGPVGACALAITVTRFDLDLDLDPGADAADGVGESWSGVFTGPAGGYLSTPADGDRVRYTGVGGPAVRAHWGDVLGPARVADGTEPE